MSAKQKRNKPKSCPIVLCLLATVSTTAIAQQVPAAESLTLQQALAQSVTLNPLLDAARNRTVAAQGLGLQAGLKPNPRLTVVNENVRAWEFSTPFRFAHSTDTWVYASQTVERRLKLQSRVDYASAGVSRASAEAGLTAVQIHGRVAYAYWNASATARVVDLYRADLAVFEQIVDYNRQRVREGAAAGADLLRTEIERDRLMATEKRAEQDAELAQITLLREMGRSDYPALHLTDALDVLPTPASVLAEEALRGRWEIRVAEAALRQQERNAALQRANGLVDPEWGFGYKRTAGLDGLYLGLNIALPLHNRNQGNIAAAEADADTARNLLRALRIQLRAEFEAAQHDYTAKKAALEQTIVPLRIRAQEAERIALAAYREGGMELLRFLDAERTRIDTEVLYYRSLTELQQSIVNLQLAQGKDL